MIISDGIYYGLPIGAQGFRRLRAATYFAHGGKVGKTPPGTAQDGHWRAHIRLTPDPGLRESLLRSSAKFPARGKAEGW